MGQYRLWLQYREIDQLLHAQLKTLVKELTQVDEQIDLLASTTLPVDNVIIQALLKELQVEVSLVPVPDVPVQAISSPIQSSPTSELPLLDLLRPSDSTPGDSPASPVDQQSIRVNQVVKRWFERRTHFAHGASRNLEEQKESMA